MGIFAVPQAVPTTTQASVPPLNLMFFHHVFRLLIEATTVSDAWFLIQPGPSVGVAVSTVYTLTGGDKIMFVYDGSCNYLSIYNDDFDLSLDPVHPS